MKVTRCGNGHYYDSDLYASCPHCGGGRAAGGAAAETAPVRKVKFLDFVKKIRSGVLPLRKPEAEEYECGPTELLSKEEIGELLSRSGRTDSAEAEAVTESSGAASAAPGDRAGQEDDVVCGGRALGGDAVRGNQALGGMPAPVAPQKAGVKPEEERFTADGASGTAKAGAAGTAKAGAAGAAQAPAGPLHSGSPREAEMPKYIPDATVGYFAAGTEAFSPCVGWLCALSGCYRGRSFELKSGGNAVGRAEGNAVMLSEDYRVSRTLHAMITYEPRSREFYIAPGTGTGLTYVNGEAILHQRVLLPGDTIEMGGGTYRFVPLCGAEFSWEHPGRSDPICRDRTGLEGVNS